MVKAIDNMHSRSKFVRVGMSCMGQRLVGAYRTLKETENNKQFCMMLYWNGFDDSASFTVHETDEYMHLYFEDVDSNREREDYLREHGSIQISSAVTESKEYKRVYDQLLRAFRKNMVALGYEVFDDLSVAHQS